MEAVSLKTLNIHPVGRSIVNVLSFLSEGHYALVPSKKKSGRTDILVYVESHGTNFYRYLHTINFPFNGIKKSNLFPNYPVERNASPAGSDCQDYAMDALLFKVD